MISRNTKETRLTSITGCWLIYGPPDSGKTYSVLTCPEPIALINSESKDPLVSLGVEASGKDITIIENANYYETMEWLNGQVENPAYKTLYMDGLTVAMSNYRSFLADDRAQIRWDKLTDKEKAIAKDLVRDKLSIEMADWGLMAEMMLRQTKLLNALSKKGVLVVATAIDTAYPKWDKSLSAAPSLLGQDYSKQIHGLFDFIGYIVQGWRLGEDGTISPPRVSFHAPAGEYLARASGKLSRVRGNGPLNFTKMLQLINQEEVKNEATPMPEMSETPKLL